MSFALAYPEVTPRLNFGPDLPPRVSLTEKYQPTTLSEVVGQGANVFQLGCFLEAPYPRSFMFAGGTGVGKSSTAKAFAADLGCDPFWGITTIDAGKQDGDSVERAADSLRFASGRGSGWKALIVNEADHMTDKAKMLWLSILDPEGLPPRSVVIFTTNKLERFEQRLLDRFGVPFLFESGGKLLLQDAQALIDRVWAGELGMWHPAPSPKAAEIKGLYDKLGNISFRRAVESLEPLINIAKRQETKRVEPPADVTPAIKITVPVAIKKPDAEPEATPARQAESIEPIVDTLPPMPVSPKVNLPSGDLTGATMPNLKMRLALLAKAYDEVSGFLDAIEDQQEAVGIKIQEVAKANRLKIQ